MAEKCCKNQYAMIVYRKGVFIMLNIGQRIKERRMVIGMSLSELARKIDVPKSTLHRYENSNAGAMSADLVVPIAKVLKTTPEYLLGFSQNPQMAQSEYSYANVFPVEPSAKLAVAGVIRAGQPICTNQNESDTETVDAKYADGNHFLLKVQGDSMSPTIPDGSIAIIRVQDTAEKGQIVAFAMDGEYATLKRYLPQPDGSVLLRADNPLADSYIIKREQFEAHEAFILGVCKSYKVNL